MISRRGFLLGLGAALAAPAVVRAESLMKIAVLRKEALTEVTFIRLIEQMPPLGFPWPVAYKIFMRDGALVRRPVYAEEFYA